MKKIIAELLLLLLITPVMIMAVDRADYNSGLEKYKNKEYEAAFPLFEKFISEYPDSIKADDATWYLGRIYKRLDRIEDAENAFKKVLQDPGSNRFEEASYDLGNVLYSKKLYSDVIDLLSSMNSLDVFSSYFLKSQELIARSWYRLAYSNKLNYNEPKAIKLFNKSITIYEYLETLITDEADLSRIHFAMAKIYSHLADLAYDSDTYQVYRKKNLEYVEIALPSISDFYRPRAEEMLVDIENSKKTGFNSHIIASAGADNLSVDTFGANVYVRTSLNIPTSGRSSFIIDTRYKHDSFDFVTSNFEKTLTGDIIQVQSTDTFSADLSWKTGTRRNVYNKLKLFSDFQSAEDIRDNYISAGVYDLGSFRFNPNWRFDWKSQFEWRSYPNYLSSGRKLDYIEGYFDPSLSLYAYDWLTVSLIYGIDIKQYLDSKYDTSVFGTDSTLNKMNLYNSGELVLDFQAGKVYNPVLSYKFNYLKTFNYNYWVSGLPADRFIEGYYDYISHSITFDNNFAINTQFKIFFGTEFILTNFINYPARDDTQTFIDELRADTALKLDLGAKYIFWVSPKGTEFEARLSGWWDYKASNMTYNTTFDTNYSFAGITVGMSVKMP